MNELTRYEIEDAERAVEHIEAVARRADLPLPEMYALIREMGKPERRLLTIGEVAETLHVSKPTVHKLIGLGHITRVHVEGAARILRTSLDDYLDRLALQESVRNQEAG